MFLPFVCASCHFVLFVLVNLSNAVEHCARTCMDTFIYICVCVCVCVCVCCVTHMYVHVHTYLHIIHICTYCMFCVGIFLCVHVHVCPLEPGEVIDA